jgi:hypothetical protein
MPINEDSATNLHNMFSHITSKYSCFSTCFSSYCSGFFSSSNCPPSSIRSCLLLPCPQSSPNGLLFTLKNYWVIRMKRLMWWLLLLHIQDAWLQLVAGSFFFVVLHKPSNTHCLLVYVCSRSVPKQTL